MAQLGGWFDDYNIPGTPFGAGDAEAGRIPGGAAHAQLLTVSSRNGEHSTFHIAAERRYDRRADRGRLREALESGATIYLPQVHQVLPRLARLIVALCATIVGPFREESSFLFVVEGRGRAAMGLHHDGEFDSFWLQLEGRRTVTVGPRVKRGTPADFADDHARGAG